MSPNYVNGIGPLEPELMIVGEAPGREENEAMEPLVGPTGQLTREMIEACGISWNDIYRTNVVKYQPPMNDFTKLHLIDVDLAASQRKLWDEEINVFKPKCIIAMGEHALNAVTNHIGITNYRGSILKAQDGVIKVVPTLHIARLLNRRDIEPLPYIYKKIIQHDLQRAVDQSKFRDFRILSRTLDIARDSLQVFRFFEEYRKLGKPAVDIESINCVPVSVSFAFTKYHAISIPLLGKIGAVKLTDMSSRELIECWRIIDIALREHDVIGQNFKYDEYKLILIGFIIKKLISDIHLKAHTILPELPDKGLGMLTSLWTEEPFYKDEGKEAKLGKHFDTDKFFKYNCKDSCVTKEIDDAMEDDLAQLSEAYSIPLKDFFYNFVMRKHSFYLKMENIGWNVDYAKKKQLMHDYTVMELEKHNELVAQIGHEVNVKSYPQMYELLYKEMRFKAPKRDPTSEDAIVVLLGNHCKGAKAKEYAVILENVLEERRIRDQLSRQINFTPDYDKRCKTSYKITGTETARTSTNILKKPIRPKKIGLAFHTISKHGRLAKDIRSMFIPDKGKVIIQADASQAEARIVAVLSRNFELVKAFDLIDIHRRTAGLIYGFTSELNLRPGDIGIVDHLEKDGPERFTGKTTRHAGNYNMKKHRFMTEFNTAAQKADKIIRISEWRAGQILDLFHAADPSIRGVFHEEIKQALDNTRCLINPFGRPRVFYDRWDEDIWKEGFAHIPQSSVADLVQGAAIKIDDEFAGDTEVFFVSENHDALVIQAPANNWEPYAKIMKKHMMTPIDFSTYCSLKRDYILTIPCDIEIGTESYAKLEKVKV